MQTAKRRLDTSRIAIARLGALMQMRISHAYHSLRIEEIELTADWLMMKQEEKEQEREERQLREERRVEELAEERARRQRNALLMQTLETSPLPGRRMTTSSGGSPTSTRRSPRMTTVQPTSVRATCVISTGERSARGVVKIGLTPRLDPRTVSASSAVPLFPSASTFTPSTSPKTQSPSKPIFTATSQTAP